MRVNIGCGCTPTPNWLNIDNSLSVKIARWKLPPQLLARLGLIDKNQQQAIYFLRANKSIIYANAAKHIPLEDSTVEVLYSSHMLEHLDRQEAEVFLSEAFRVMAPRAIIRLAVPDLQMKLATYMKYRDADAFIESTYMTVPKPRTLVSRLRLLIVGPRHHQWLYDTRSLSKLLLKMGFEDAIAQPPGNTRIADPGLLNLHERAEDSIYVEATKPAQRAA